MRSEHRARVAATDTPELFRQAVDEAARLLRAGELVVLPTETVYGLAANAFDAAAVSRIYEIKGRPAHNPIIVHVSDEGMARRCVKQWPESAHRLCRAFWPGPLTLVLPRAPDIPDIVTAGGETVGVRWPSHPFIQAVIRECGFPLAAPSANPSNRVSPTNAAHVVRYFKDAVPLIVDGGQSQVGIESTVLDLSESPPQILRPGMIHEASLAAVVGAVASQTAGGTAVLKSPGQLKRHYSPRARLLILEWRNQQELRSLASQAGPLDKTHVIAHNRVPSGSGFGRVSVIPHDSEAFARALYAELHECDALGAQNIIIEAPPESREWKAISDRLTRAAAR